MHIGNSHNDDDLSTKLSLFGACEMKNGQKGIITGRKASYYGGIITHKNNRVVLIS
jgi:hypothetical protein